MIKLWAVTEAYLWEKVVLLWLFCFLHNLSKLNLK